MKMRLYCLWAAAAIGGCASQAPSDYEGEPLATLHGTIAVKPELTVTEAEMALVWPGTFPTDFIGVYRTTRAPVVGEFPARFTLDLFTPPPALLPVEDAAGQPSYGFGVALLAPVKSGSPEFPVKTKDCILGSDADPRFFVVYVDRDLTEDDLAPPWDGYIDPQAPKSVSSYLGKPLSKGYHLMTAGAVDAKGNISRFDEMADGFDTELTVTISKVAGPDCREPRKYPYDGGIP